MHKGLKIVGIIAGIISILAFISLGCVYMKKLIFNFVDLKKKIFIKLNQYSKKQLGQ